MEMSFQDLKRDAQNTSDAVSLGFSTLNSTICNQQYDTARMINGLENTIQGGFNATNIALLQGQNALASQLAQCCCDQRAATEALKFTIAQEDCATRNLIQSTATQMMVNNNDNTRAILDKLTSQEMEAKNAQIASLNQQLFTAQLAASQAAQTAQIVNTLNPVPVPAYPAASPCGLGNWSPSVLSNGYGFNNGCGCCNG